MKLKLTPHAERELAEATLYYEEQLAGLGKRFLHEVQRCKRLIMSFPEAWHPLDDTFRRCRLNHFPYGLIYTIRGNTILVVSVSHLHRHPDHWTFRS